jgi:CHAT domain-containing protein
LTGESLSALYGNSVTQADDATAKHLVRQVAAGDVVHVAGRVVSNDEYPGLSRLQMADEPGQRYSGSVYARNIADSGPIRAQLVAIESGTAGTITTGTEDGFGFARALLAAGVSNVVSPVADVEGASVERTWLDFHRHYAAGAAAAESLRRAQLTALSESHRPGPWATLTVFGSTQ